MRSHRAALTGLVGAALGLAFLVAPDRKVIYETRSAYNHIIVQEDEEGLRYLLFSENGAQQSVRRPGATDVLELPYSRSMMVGLACVKEPARMLVVGLGGGSIPAFLHQHYPKTCIDCVDIDPEVIAVAKRFFGFQEDDRLKAHAADGRKFIEETTNRYDVILLDAYGDNAIPIALTTREFLTAVRRALSPQGVVLGNIWSRFSNPHYDSMLVTYREVFDQLYLFYVPGRGNIIFLAVPRPGTLTMEELMNLADAVVSQNHLGFDLRKLVRYGYEDARKLNLDAPVLEDPK